MVISPVTIQSRLRQLGIRPDKYLGQHFLIDQTVLDAITSKAKEVTLDADTLVEVGPGLGILTEELLKLNQQTVISVEKDPVLARNVPRFVISDRLTIIQGDILTELDTNDTFQTLDSWVFVANIPYAITSPLIRKLIDRPNPPHHILMLVQKESAERITAPAGSSERGLLTIQVEIRAEAQIIADIAQSSFWPEPKVKSALVLITIREEPLIPTGDEAQFFKVVQAGFSAKRKQLLNSLSGGLALPRKTILPALTKAAIDPNRRAETLTVAEWMALTKILLPNV